MDRRFWLFAGGAVLALCTYPIADPDHKFVSLLVTAVYIVIAFGWFLDSVSRPKT